MKPQDHAAATEEILGRGFLHVHHYLDRTAPCVDPSTGRKYFNKYHRKATHHMATVEECRAMWGDIGALVAKLHIYQDLAVDRDGRQMLPDHSWRIPVDTQDFIRQGWV